MEHCMVRAVGDIHRPGDTAVACDSSPADVSLVLLERAER